MYAVLRQEQVFGATFCFFLPSSPCRLAGHLSRVRELGLVWALVSAWVSVAGEHLCEGASCLCLCRPLEPDSPGLRVQVGLTVLSLSFSRVRCGLMALTSGDTGLCGDPR